MAEKVEEKSKVNPDNNGEEKPVEEKVEKDTNKTYDQSEFDKEVSRQVAEATDKFKGHNELQEKYDELEKWKKEKELESMTETEKSQKLVEELKKKNEDLGNQVKASDLSVLRSNILSDAKYLGLPRAYKSMVKGESEEEIKSSADSIFDEYKKDFTSAGGKVTDIPPPNLGKDGNPITTTPQTVAEKIKAVMAEKAEKRQNSL